MDSSNETVECILDDMRKRCIDKVHSPTLWPYLDRIADAHKREMEDSERVSNAVISELRDAKLRMYGEIVKKDDEIAQLVSVINSECNKCGDCAKLGSDCNAGDIDGNEDCRACKKFVSKDVSAYRALVKEMTDILLSFLAILHNPCSVKQCREECSVKCREMSALVAKAQRITAM